MPASLADLHGGNRMKYITKMFVLFAMIFTIAGCGNNKSSHSGVNSGNSVDKVINEQMSRGNPAGSDTKKSYPEPEEGLSADDLPQERQGTDDLPEASEETGTQAAAGVDYDLTAMSSDMVYAMVYHMMTDPYTYVGKTFRMDGLYYSVYYEPTAKYYHYCIIQDALACCAQGMEFVLDDGTHTSPEDYPEENTGVVVQGVFETYQEDGDSSLYCRLNDAVMEIGDN